MDKLERYWKKIPKAVRKSLVLIAGSMVIVAGLLMLVFPGPGWAAIFLGFAILATEFAFAEKARDWMIGQLKRLVHFLEKKWHKIWKKLKH